LHRSTFLLAALLLLSACRQASPELALSGPTMGTTYNVKVAAPPANIDSYQVRVVIDEVLARIDRSMSGYRRDSEISRFNASASTEWIDVSVDLATVIRAALEVSELSHGAFDVTVMPLVNLWGFGAAQPADVLPDEATIARTRARVGYRKLHVRTDPPALRKDTGDITIDLNGIAPGYAVDLLAERFLSLHIENFMIDIGGEVLARGRNASGEPWRIAVERPIDAEPTAYAIVQLDNMSVTTSGEYRHYYLRDGRRYSHTIDPRTGKPVDHDLAAVVVVGPTSTYIDAWATALNVLGSEAGYALAAEHHLPVMFIDGPADRLRPRLTAQFERYLAVRPAESGGE
jgi:FAD:protein FMN transferase